MMQTAELMALVELFLKQLSTSEKIKNWCMEKYNKEPWFIVGMDYNKPPDEDECPYIVILPSRKGEGHIAELKYYVNIAWCISNQDIVNDGAVTRFKGLLESDELGNLILKETAQALKESHIETVDYTIDGLTQYPQFPGEMEIMVSVPYTIGIEKILF